MRTSALVLAPLLAAVAMATGFTQDQVPKLSGKDGPLKVYVTARGAPLRERPDGSSTVLASADYLAPYYVAAEDASRAYYLLATADPDSLLIGRKVGWAARRHCVETVVDKPLECLRHPDTKIYRKAMLVNRLVPRKDAATSLAPSRDAADLQRPVDFLDRPDPQGESHAQRRLFDIYYVFAEDSEHLLLGQEPRVDRDAQRRQVLLGWVPSQRVCLWNTREAVEFNKSNLEQRRSHPCLIFESLGDMRAYTDFRPETPYLAKEDLTVTDWKYFQARFPLLDDQDSDHQGKPYRGVNLFKIGAIGDVWIEGEEGLRVAVTARQAEQLRQRVRDLRDQASNIQICFVVDATFSMDRWFPAVARSVRSIIDGVQTRARTDEISPQVNISFNFYRDRGEDRRQFQSNPYLGASESLTIFEKQQPLGGHLPYELVFAGICRSLHDHPFLPGATKVLVLIGDDGNRPDDPEYTLDGVCTALIQAGRLSPVGFCALAVGGDDQRAIDQRSLFEQQAGEIARRLAEEERKRIQKGGVKLDEQTQRAIEELVGQVVVTGDMDAVVAAIHRRFEVAVAEMNFQRKQLEALETGSVPNEEIAGLAGQSGVSTEMLKTFGVIWQQRMRDRVRQEGLEPLELARQGVQLFSEGWVAETDPLVPSRADGQRVPQIRHMVFMQKSELRRLVVLLDMLLHHWDDGAIDQTWKTALASVVDPKVQVRMDATPAELLQMHLGIKAKEGILAVPLERFAQSAADRAKLKETLKRKHGELLDVLDERKGKSWWGDERRGDDLRAWIGRELLP